MRNLKELRETGKLGGERSSAGKVTASSITASCDFNLRANLTITLILPVFFDSDEI